MTSCKLADEKGRLLALHRYGVLDSLREPNFDNITSIVRDLVNVPICAVSLVDEDRQWFKSIQGLAVESTDRSVAFCDHTIRNNRPMIINDARADPRFSGNPLVTGDPLIRAYAGAPLTSPDGYNLGSLCVIDRRPRDFTEVETALLERFAKLVVDQMELRTLAHRDFLTGALTRRAFIDGAITALRQRGPAGRKSTAAILDVDHFKQINDRFGHSVGDQVLKRIVGRIRDDLGAADLFGRLGGEEFGLLFHTGEGEGQIHVVERLRVAIEEMWEPGLPKVSVSIGFAQVHSAADLEPALARADVALYLAKGRGRNRCIGEQPSLAQVA